MSLRLPDLPYELFSAILSRAARLNSGGNAKYTYGLSQAPEPAQDVRMQRVVRGYTPIDSQKWMAVDAMRQINRRFHDWAVEYALKDLYITRWRGSERWIQSRNLSSLNGSPSGIAVYRDPYHSLRATLKLFTANPALATCVQRIWFDGYYDAETNAMIFSILNLCTNIRYVTLPWTALRYGTADDLSQLLGGSETGNGVESLELLAVDLKQSQIEKKANESKNEPLDSAKVNFGSLCRLKIQGHSNFKPLVDADLVSIARTATNLREIHIIDTTSPSIDGISALAKSSQETLEVLEHSPARANVSSHPQPSPVQAESPPQSEGHVCQRILACPRLQSLSLTLPSICPALFATPTVKWSGEVQIRAWPICSDAPQHTLQPSPVSPPTKAHDALWSTLDAARTLIASRLREGADLSIEIHIGDWIFEPRSSSVHGNFVLAKVLAEGLWPAVTEGRSGKGPYGQNEAFGKEGGEWTVIGEEVFAQGLRRGYVSLP